MIALPAYNADIGFEMLEPQTISRRTWTRPPAKCPLSISPIIFSACHQKSDRQKQGYHNFHFNCGIHFPYYCRHFRQPTASRPKMPIASKAMAEGSGTHWVSITT